MNMPQDMITTGSTKQFHFGSTAATRKGKQVSKQQLLIASSMLQGQR